MLSDDASPEALLQGTPSVLSLLRDILLMTAIFFNYSGVKRGNKNSVTVQLWLQPCHFTNLLPSRYTACNCRHALGMKNLPCDP